MFSHIHTTIQIDNRIFAELKKIAMDTVKRRSAVIQDALREPLSRCSPERPAIAAADKRSGGMKQKFSSGVIRRSVYID